MLTQKDWDEAPFPPTVCRTPLALPPAAAKRVLASTRSRARRLSAHQTHFCSLPNRTGSSQRRQYRSRCFYPATHRKTIHENTLNVTPAPPGKRRHIAITEAYPVYFRITDLCFCEQIIIHSEVPDGKGWNRLSASASAAIRF